MSADIPHLNGILRFSGVDYLFQFMGLDEEAFVTILIHGIIRNKEPIPLPSNWLEIGQIYRVPLAKVKSIDNGQVHLVYDTKKFASNNFYLFTRMGNDDEAAKWKPLLETHLLVNTEGPKHA